MPRVTVARETLAAWRRLGRRQETYGALCALAFESARVGDLDNSASALTEASDLEESTWPARRRTLRALAQAGVAIFSGDASAYRLASQRELALAEEAGAACIAAWAKIKLADAALMAEDCDEAISRVQQLLPELEALNQTSARGSALAIQCSAHLISDDLAGAQRAARQFLPLCWRDEEHQFDNVALLAARLGNHDASARMLGFTDAWYGANQEQRQATAVHLARMAASLSEAALGPDEYARGRAAGAAMSPTQAEALIGSILG